MYSLIFGLLVLVCPAYGLFNCTRYQQPCQIEGGAPCCGYPFFDCLSDGVDRTCQDLRDFPELSAEFLLRIREAMDRGQAANTTIADLRRNVNGLLGVQGNATGGFSVTTTTRRPPVGAISQRTRGQQQVASRLQRPGLAGERSTTTARPSTTTEGNV